MSGKTLAPVGSWQCVWKDCDQSWSGTADETPDDWRWIGDLFTLRRLLRLGDIVKDRAIKYRYMAFFTPTLCPGHWPLVGDAGVTGHLTPRMFFAAVGNDHLAEEVCRET